MQDRESYKTDRRNFLGKIATGAAAVGIASMAPITAGAKKIVETSANEEDPDAWFKSIKGKHRIVFDVTGPNDLMPFAWPRVFLMTNEMTGTPAKDSSVVVVFRHDAIPYAMHDNLWSKYNLGEVFHINDPATKAASVRNPFWKPKAGDYKIPGVGNVAIGINELQDNGVKFCVCNVALTVYSAVVAQQMGLDAAQLKKEWEAGILPGVKVVPSGVWAIGRAQEHGCGYIFAS